MISLLSDQTGAISRVRFLFCLCFGTCGVNRTKNEVIKPLCRLSKRREYATRLFERAQSCAIATCLDLARPWQDPGNTVARHSLLLARLVLGALRVYNCVHIRWQDIAPSNSFSRPRPIHQKLVPQGKDSKTKCTHDCILELR